MRHVSDGDTLVLEDGSKVRLIGVDTPEMSDAGRNRQNARRNGVDAQTVESFAQKAKAFTREAVEGRKVRLDFDWQRTDKYGRLLAYVYRVDDGLYLNAEILKRGYGFAYTYFPFRESEAFVRYAAEARSSGRGLWSGGDA